MQPHAAHAKDRRFVVLDDGTTGTLTYWPVGRYRTGERPGRRRTRTRPTVVTANGRHLHPTVDEVHLVDPFLAGDLVRVTPHRGSPISGVFLRSDAVSVTVLSAGQRERRIHRAVTAKIERDDRPPARRPFATQPTTPRSPR